MRIYDFLKKNKLEMREKFMNVVVVVFFNKFTIWY